MCCLNPVVLFFKCTHCMPKRKKTKLEKAIKIGSKRVERQLDVRSLIVSQSILHTLAKVLIKPSETREMMKMQRKHKVLEPYGSATSSSSDEENLTMKAKKQQQMLQRFLVALAKVDNDVEAAADMDAKTKELMMGVLRMPSETPKKRKKAVKDEPFYGDEIDKEAGSNPIDFVPGNKIVDQRGTEMQHIYQTNELSSAKIVLDSQNQSIG